MSASDLLLATDALPGGELVVADAPNLERDNMDCVGDITDRPSKAVAAVLRCTVIRAQQEICSRARKDNNEGCDHRQIQSETRVRSLRRIDSSS